MKRWQFIAILGSIPLALAAVVWQAGRFASLSTEARALEERQREWVDANRKLLGSISVLESRERAAENARRLGLQKAGADRRIFIDITRPPSAGSRSGAPAPGDDDASRPGSAGKSDG